MLLRGKNKVKIGFLKKIVIKIIDLFMDIVFF